MIRYLFFVTLFCFVSLHVKTQATYHKARFDLQNMLEGRDSLDLQKAIYIVEDAWYDGHLNKDAFYNRVDQYANFCEQIIASGDIRYQGEGDEEVAKTQCAVFVFMTDSIPVQLGNQIIWHQPFTYNFDDYAGRQDWSNMFVSTLMQTRKGNCHSMPLLYKLIMDKLGEKSWLALAPNHMYIKAWNKRAGWYNIELTCGDFPTDAWLTATGYIHLDAIRSGIYMDTLSVRQSIALCLTDLAQGYKHKYGMGSGRFIQECCDMALAHFPDYINALLLKAEVITQNYLNEKDFNGLSAEALKTKMDEIYTLIHQLGYRKMPDDMYFSWLYSLNEYSIEYRNKKITVYKNIQDLMP